MLGNAGSVVVVVIEVVLAVEDIVRDVSVVILVLGDVILNIITKQML